MNEDEQEILRKDQTEHPNCSYRKLLQDSCSTKNGEHVCERLTKIDRLCPGQKPVTIFSTTEKGSGKPNDIGGLEELMQKVLGDVSKLPGFPPGILPPPGALSPPPHSQPKRDQGSGFSWGGSMIDESPDSGTGDSGGIAGFLRRFGIGEDHATEEKRPPRTHPRGPDESKKPPGGTPVGPSQDV